MEKQKINTLILNVTNACNLNCKYCFIDKQTNYMSLDIAIQAVEYGYQNKEKEYLLLIFFGGEPLLCYDTIIFPLVNYIKNKQYKINFSITTNGTLLTKEKIDFFRQNNIKILFSFDGNKKTQDYNRSNSFDIVIKNIPYLLEQYPNTICRSTVYLDTLSNLYEDYLFLNQCGFKFLYCGFDVTSKNWQNKDFILLEEQLQKIKNNPTNLTVLNFRNFNEKELPSIPLKKLKMYPCDRCGLGTISQAVNYEGKIFACHHINTTINNIFYIGDIYSGIDPIKHQKLLNLFLNSLENTIESDVCKECNMTKFCHYQIDGVSDCLIDNYLNRNSFNKTNPNMCKILNLFYKFSLQ